MARRAARGAATAAGSRPEINSTARGINKVLVAALAAAIVLLVQQWGQPDAPSAGPAPQGDAPVATAGFSGLDEERVAVLEAALAEDPDDLSANRELARLYNDAGLWNESADYHQRVLEQAPTDLDALLALGVIQFNMGDVDAAEATWLRAVEAHPDQPEPYFNLGFAYLGMEPAQGEEAKEMWETLIAVAPDPELAATARSHIDALPVEGG